MSMESFLQGYLFAWIFWAGLTIGCVSLYMLHHMIRAKWGIPIYRLLEAGVRMLPLVAVAFIPVAYGYFNHMIYPWANPALAGDEFIRHRAGWNNPVWFTVRTAIYFLFWFGWTDLLRRSAKKQDENDDFNEALRRSSWAAPGLVLHVLVVTVAMTDWVMSLDVRWFSTMFGGWFLVSQGLCAIAFSVVIVCWYRVHNREPYAAVIDKPMLRDLGNVMLALVMFWTYFALAQLLIIWSGNLPDETRYYATRMNAQWNPLGTAIFFLQFVVPFGLLLLNMTKRSARFLRTVAVLILAIRIADVYWTVIPFFNAPEHAVGPVTLLPQSAISFIVLGAIWLVGFRAVWRSNTPLPTHDSRLQLQEAHGHA